MRTITKTISLCGLCLATISTFATPKAPAEPTKNEATQKAPHKKKDSLKRKKKERGPGKAINEMNYQELKAEKNRLLSYKDDESAMRYIEKMIPMSNDPKELQETTLELAEILLRLEQYAKAQIMYTDFVKFYPGSSQLEEASYHAIEASFKQMLEADRDQTKTKETLSLAQAFLARPIFTAYRSKVVTIAHDCNARLWDHEEYVITHYLQRGKLMGARKHIDALEKNLLPVLPDCQLRFLAVQASFADACHKPKEAEEKRALIQAKLSKDPSLKQTPLVLAQASTGKQGKTFTQRF